MKNENNKNVNKQVGERPRLFSLITYLSEQELSLALAENSERISKYAFAYHDCDVWDSDSKDSITGEFVHRKGELKKPHIHLILYTYYPSSARAVAKWFKTDFDNSFGQVVQDLQVIYEYLWHKNDTDKFQYSKTIVRSNDINWFEKSCREGKKPDSDRRAELIVNDLILGVSFRTMLARYGRDFVIHLSQYEECANRIRQQDVWEREKRLTMRAYEKAQLEELSKPVQQEFDFDKK